MDGGIKFDVSANTAKFDADMARVGNVATRSADKVKQAFSGLGGLLAGGAVLGGLKTIMDDFDKVAKVATRFGASAEDIQRVSVAADLAGVSIDTVARVLTKMSVAASDAGNGNDAMAESFKRAGINAEQFKNAGLQEQLIMLSEAFNRARGDADATNQVIELMGTRAAGQMIPLIDNTAALRQEMEGVSVASDETVRRIEAANDRMTKFFNELKVGAAGALGFITDTAERFGSLLGGAGFKTIAELDEIQLRANAIAQLTSEGLLGGNDDENARLIAERMEEIQNKLKGNKTIVADINEDLGEANSLEKEKTAQLERQQQLLEQQEAKRKEAIKDAQFEVDLIEAKLRGDEARVAALEEQRDFERALEQTGSTETAASLASARAAERAAKAGGGGSSGGGGGGGTSKQDLTFNQKVGELKGKLAAEPFFQKAQQLADAGMASSSIKAQMRGEERMKAEMEKANLKDFAKREFDAGNLGEAYQKYKDEVGFDPNRMDEKEFKDWAKQQAKTDKEIADNLKDKGGEGGAGGGASGGGDPFANMVALLKSIDKKLPQHALT